MAQAQEFGEIGDILFVTVGVFSALIGFSAIIAAFGMVNNLSLSVLQRTRGAAPGARLRRSAGAGDDRGRERPNDRLRSRAGLLLGIGYGWAGAQSLLGAMYASPWLVWPSVPWLLVVVLAVD